VLLYFSGPSGSLMLALLSVENWVPLKPVLGEALGTLNLFTIPHVQTQPKQSAILLWLRLPRDPFIFQIFIHVLHNSRCQVLCGSCKKLPRTSLQCYYILWSIGIIDASTIKCWELSTAQASAGGKISLMYRLNQNCLQ
jgi:hypothetical protein